MNRSQWQCITSSVHGQFQNEQIVGKLSLKQLQIYQDDFDMLAAHCTQVGIAQCIYIKLLSKSGVYPLSIY